MLTKDSRLLELYTEIGQTMWLIQELEQALVMLIALVEKVPQGTAREEADTILIKIKKGTLGRLVKTLKETVELEVDFEQRLDSFVDERNWLAHRMVDQNRTDPLHEQRMEILINRVEQLGYEAESIRRLFSSYIAEYVTSKGVDPKAVEEKAMEIIKSWTEK